MDVESQENGLVSRTSRLLHLYRKRNHLQQMLQQYEIKVKSACGTLLMVLSLSCSVMWHVAKLPHSSEEVPS